MCQDRAMAKLSGQITVAAVGKIKARHWRAAQEDYLHRLNRYTTIKLVEVKDVVGRGQPETTAVLREGEMLWKAASSARRHIVLTPAGQLLDSENFARFLKKEIETYGRIAFLIGGPLGFSQDLLDRSDKQLALSPLTFTHELARVILLEQLYRAATIIAGEKYHK